MSKEKTFTINIDELEELLLCNNEVTDVHSTVLSSSYPISVNCDQKELAQSVNFTNIRTKLAKCSPRIKMLICANTHMIYQKSIENLVDYSEAKDLDYYVKYAFDYFPQHEAYKLIDYINNMKYLDNITYNEEDELYCNEEDFHREYS